MRIIRKPKTSPKPKPCKTITGWSSDCSCLPHPALPRNSPTPEPAPTPADIAELPLPGNRFASHLWEWSKVGDSSQPALAFMDCFVFLVVGELDYSALVGIFTYWGKLNHKFRQMYLPLHLWCIFPFCFIGLQDTKVHCSINSAMQVIPINWIVPFMLLLPPIKCKGAQVTGTSKMGVQKTIF